ncbi:bifunctional glycosyltransferase/CDP-glycerol:glycerophosphate glycerophosphotransferase [Actinacidiphila epipremni]|uniref:CDP-glycerol:glycerophosphate glycerophosphotransferase n=1 Tax=Actinacidiphila epipremni TaxID=2053013 RepID=A0ABX0ZJK2_9ACTN|nr:CDP-glycerol:glycerophosphate glycerophosphotransferase [Actinacidiphila epipremni]NJP41833.1 CDP-glycerol:glycerophosphate glycerophosphotransferase [Actinacidiphila epipremni]
MPRFSVVVPAHRVQGFLRPCLESVLGQSFGDLEVIAVDDASPDATGAVVADLAAADPRVVPVRMDRNAGTGPARDAGAATATGDYLLFLDADDLMAPGALAAIDARLTRTGDPDVLLFDHERFTVWENVLESGDAGILAAVGPDVFTAADRPDCLGLFPAVWNRAVRRDHWAARGLAFGDAPYADLALATRELTGAQRIACLDRVCVRWRKRRSGSLSTTPGPHHLAVLDAYEELFAEVTEPAQRAALYGQMAAVLMAVGEDRLTAGGEAAFVRRAGKLLTAHRPAGWSAPEAKEALWVRAAGTGSYPRYRAAMGLRALAAGAVKRLRAQRHGLARAVYQRYYRMRLRRPVDPHLVVYAAYWNRGVACNPAAIYRKAQEIAPHLHGVWVVGRRDREALPPGVDHVVVNTRRYWDVLARARYLVNNANFTGNVVKRPEQTYVQTHHGTPLKHMGMDLRARPAVGKGMSFGRLLDHADQWDYSLVANQHSAEVFDRVYPSGYATLPSGYPRNDVFYTAGPDEVRRARQALGLADGTTAILYAPTHRDYQREFVLPLDLERLARELGPGYTLLVRAHYFYGASPELEALHAAGAVVDVSGHPSVEELCLASDALVTDFSSLMFDYANLDRPILVHAADWAAYSAARGVYFDLLSGRPGETPGVVAHDESALARAFHSGEWADEPANALRAAFRLRFCSYDDGLAAERVVRRVFLSEDQLLPYRPLPDRHPAPAPASSDPSPATVPAP